MLRHYNHFLYWTRIPVCCITNPVLFTEGRLPVGVGRWSRMRCPRTRPRQAGGSGDLGTRPTGNTTRVRGASLIRPPCKHDGHGGTQARTWMTQKHRSGAPRGALPRSQGEVARSQSVPGWPTQPPWGLDAGPRVSRRSASPHIPGASRRGNERGCARGKPAVRASNVATIRLGEGRQGQDERPRHGSRRYDV
jgi:hypothetical protein